MKPPADAVDFYLPARADVLDVRQLTVHEKYLKLRFPDDQLTYMPGQFMELSVPCIGEAPISIASSHTRNGNGTFEIVVRQVGGVTTALHTLEPGDWVGVRGPFGTHFPVDGAMRGKDLLFICGGIGLVPVRSAIQYVLDNREDYGHVTILSGTRRPEDRLFVDELLDWKVRPDVDLLETVDSADPAWGGDVGVITTLFRRLSVSPENTVAIVCGPPIMYKFVLLELHNLEIGREHVYVSLERRMKCGVGKCGHCQINGLYACQDGPVFRYSDVLTATEAI